MVDRTATAVVFEKPGVMSLRSVGLAEPTDNDCVVEVLWSGISTGTERLLWDGRMPAFPGLEYPLVPGYESVGRVVEAGSSGLHQAGDLVFVPGSAGYTNVRGLFGASAESLVVGADRLIPIDESLGDQGILLALAATAHHAALRIGHHALPDLIIGHGVLGRLLARIVIALGGDAPTVWETNVSRHSGAAGYKVITPDSDPRKDYRVIADVSGDAHILDSLIARLSPGGQVILAGFYHAPLNFSFPPAFQREVSFSIAAEWQKPDLESALGLVRDKSLSLDGLITHHQSVRTAAPAYRMAFGDPDCLKMVLDWRCMH
ncbi:chlorophyll synthesis pathway protein BchC [Congregibacter litoralis]|uniref:2-desacetyl-2-hydroxyethyl bacteriochlorophyllide A dehydrogenase n=1 Tax=Congregibacter litoralis KT71 TaxID=314285 RepID=A4ACR3_9GAMM|nr:chlorophyll synthesis pathway protein BchC [Congregibacter litoralis]EAQ96277.1 2-desacetyl-2-hydroxyethyl bacteriochlorophyllide A dehydrogenase [Congregibacter litoralis KT71]